MILSIYARTFRVLMKKPLKLWGISLLNIILSGVLGSLCGFAIPGLSLAVGLLIGTSMTMIFLYGYRGEDVNAAQLFECFKDWNTIKRVLCGMGWRLLWIMLWGLIPIVGPVLAIIRSYQYRLTPYILVMEPEVPVTEAIKVSASRTEGYKLKMWLADFLLGVAFVVVSLVLTLLGMIPYLGVLFALILFVLSIAYIVLAPLFLGLVQAAFYEEITNPTMDANAPMFGAISSDAKQTDVPKAFCPNCGTALAPDVKFCPGCGQQIQ